MQIIRYYDYDLNELVRVTGISPIVPRVGEKVIIVNINFKVKDVVHVYDGKLWNVCIYMERL